MRTFGAILNVLSPEPTRLTVKGTGRAGGRRVRLTGVRATNFSPPADHAPPLFRPEDPATQKPLPQPSVSWDFRL